MAIARKLRRPIDVGGREFLWWVYEDLEEFAGSLVLAVASADKRFLVRYVLHQPDDSRVLTIQGREFPGLPAKRTGWVSVLCPAFTSGDAVKPSDVRRLIEWSLHSDRPLTEVHWTGERRAVPPPEPATRARPRQPKKNRRSPRSVRRRT